MTTPDLKKTRHALSLVGTYSMQRAKDDLSKWEVKDGKNEHLEVFLDTASVWIMIKRKIASHINEFDRGELFLSAYEAADHDVRAEMANMISRYYISAAAHDATENLMKKLGHSPISPDNLPENWEEVLTNARSRGRLGLTLPAQASLEIGLAVIGLNDC